MLSKNCFESESEYIMLSKYLKDNALEDMKVELSKMKSEPIFIYLSNCDVIANDLNIIEAVEKLLFKVFKHSS